MDKKQFDATLGGSHQLPHDVHVMKLAASRANEIAAMTYSIENPNQNKLIFQKLPVNMRRRVMSHNAKRMPRRLREIHLNQMSKSGLPPKSKRPSRKQRRRPKNLLMAYNKRQTVKSWLETHIWHAKRFHMTEKWGYKLANFPNDKSFRANYRAVAKHCLIQDLSFLNCIEIKGPQELLTTTLKRHCDQTTLTFGAKVFLGGQREGKVTFYKRESCPKFPIGNVQFLWNSKTNGTEKTVWIWVHPAFVDEVLSELLGSFNFKQIEDAGVKCYRNDESCTMTLLKNCLNRFRLLGPLTLDILTDTLRLVDLDSEAMKSQTDYLHDYLNNPEDVEAAAIQRNILQFLATINSPNQLPPNFALALNVLDPRFYVPQRRTKVKRQLPMDGDNSIMPVPPTSASNSPLWQQSCRDKAAEACLSNFEINKLRSNSLVPGVINDIGYDSKSIKSIPIILIQNPGTTAMKKSIGFASGMDLILPKKWAMPFWLSFILRCAKPGGLREAMTICYESEDLNSPFMFHPDTSICSKEAEDRREQLLQKYFRYPPNRRVNFTKVAITSPFFCDWKLLVKEWSSCEDFTVLRDRKAISALQAVSKKVPLAENSLPKDKNVLVSVKVSVLRRGAPKDFALICLPTGEDIAKMKSTRNWSGPVESKRKDSRQKLRKSLRKDHQAVLKRQRRKRVRDKKNSKVNEAKFESQNTESLIAAHKDKMRKLYVPACTCIRNSCEREVIGFVTKGDFCMSEAKGVGYGYTVIEPLLQLIRERNNLVLIRNIQTRQYRFARINVTSL